MIKLEVNKYRNGGFSGTCLLEDLNDTQLKALGLYWTKLKPDLQLTLDVEGSFEVTDCEPLEGYTDLVLFDVSIGYKGKFIFLTEDEYNFDDTIDYIIDTYRDRIEQPYLDGSFYNEDQYDR